MPEQRERAEGSTLPDDARVPAAPFLSIIVPAYNEAQRLGRSLDRIRAYLAAKSFGAEVIVVDDGSSDGTSALVRRACETWPELRCIVNEVNRGKGFTVRRGVLEARGQYVLFTDADLSAPIDELEKLLKAAQEQDVDVVIGSRAVDRSYIEKHQSRGREFGGIVFNLMVQTILGLRIHDTQCGFKLFRRSKAAPVFERMTITGFGFDPELLFLAKRARLKIIELPVRWSHAEGSKIRFVRDSVRMFSDLLRIRWNQITGRYS